MAGSIVRFLAGGMTVAALVTSLVLTGGLAARAADVSTVPSAEPGDTIRVEGSIDFLDLDRSVTFHWDGEDGPKIGSVSVPLLQTSYESTVTIPGTATAGEHEIYACNDTCGSTTIMIEVPPATTLPPTTLPTTTLPPTTVVSTTSTTTYPTTTSPTTTMIGSVTTNPTPTSTTLASSTSSTTGPSAPRLVGPDGEATIIESSDSGSTDSAEPGNEEGLTDDATTSDETEVESFSLSQVRYIPPTISTTSAGSTTSTMSSTTASPDEERDDPGLEVVAVGGDDDGGWSLGSPLVFWSVWLLVLLVASVTAGVFGWIARRGGGSSR
jgi:hypothetical protein